MPGSLSGSFITGKAKDIRLRRKKPSRFSLEHDAPACGIMSCLLARTIMRICGWKTTGKVPEGSRFVLIGEPHTSNWDFLLMLGATRSLGLKVSWIGKHTLFRNPLGILMKYLGGIPLDRTIRSQSVHQTAGLFKTASKLIVVIGPSGTRSRQNFWKSGFYWIAHTANVPILCGYLNFATRTVHVGLSFIPTGNVKADMDRIRQFYKGVRGRHPTNETPVRLENES